MRDEVGFFADIVDVIAPDGGPLGLMLVFSDESARSDCGRLLFVGGYVFANVQAKRLNKEWAKEIALPYRELTGGADFHACDLENHRIRYGREVIDGFERRAVALINARMTHAVGVAFDEDEFRQVAPPEWFARFGNIYTICCQLCLDVTGRWAERANVWEPIRYIFESGHKHQRSADACLKNLRHHPHLVRSYRFGGHAFLSKSQIFPLQAADLFAWNFTRNHYERNVLHRSMRPTLRALLAPNPDRYDVAFLRGDKLKKFIDQSTAQEWLNKRGQRVQEKKRRRAAKRADASS